MWCIVDIVLCCTNFKGSMIILWLWVVCGIWGFVVMIT